MFKKLNINNINILNHPMTMFIPGRIWTVAFESEQF